MGDKDAFERIIAGLHEAMFDDDQWVKTSGLIDKACRTEGSILAVGDDSARIGGVLFTNFCYRGQRHREWEREYLRDYYPIDEHLPRYRHLRDSRIVHVTELFSEEELKTIRSATSWRRRAAGRTRFVGTSSASSRSSGSPGRRTWYGWYRRLPGVRELCADNRHAS